MPDEDVLTTGTAKQEYLTLVLLQAECFHLCFCAAKFKQAVHIQQHPLHKEGGNQKDLLVQHAQTKVERGLQVICHIEAACGTHATTTTGDLI